jgi:hypothetical protein
MYKIEENFTKFTKLYTCSTKWWTKTDVVYWGNLSPNGYLIKTEAVVVVNIVFNCLIDNTIGYLKI